MPDKDAQAVAEAKAVGHQVDDHNISKLQQDVVQVSQEHRGAQYAKG